MKLLVIGLKFVKSMIRNSMNVCWRVMIPSNVNIKMLVLDVDGTMTDGSMYYGEDGSELKRFNTRDGFGIRQWQESGRKVCIISGEDSRATINRCKKLGITEYYLGIEYKGEVLKTVMKEEKLTPEEVVIMGDDLNDIPMIHHAKWLACPSDAHPQVKRAANLITICKGGEGAVRELTDFLLSAQIKF
jgi:YrbI family 3-deoxy-D-manno-octulosonate 8-phosphate phosphatase